ncbi:HIT domain-containing protein [Saccharopolyspora terrae]|uniref:HIT domain-containing protein n=1 Tax=Saccharopolyspora terrae TaxID=2530384 RepID=A0A4R4VCE9_9PSEU|nr:HIT domain-containing protein [Saccharopolyspora terrae]TDD03129.1 HIT domain-containing protein [Saccharopolyspora terrae]
MRCIFCSIVAGQARATFVRSWPDVIAIRPLNPVTAGHLLVIPHRHVADVGEAPDVSGYTMAAAAELAADLPAANIITNKGAAATQTQYHLHLHVVPRNEDDALPLPWTPQQVGTGR